MLLVHWGKWATTALCLALPLLASAVASGALVAIDPVKVLLTGAAPSKSISLRNNGSERVRFQVSAFTWNQSPGGEMLLAPSQELVFFPSLLELAPGETRRVRVTTTQQASGQERSYRVFIDELPSPASGNAGAIKVLTRFGIPVFLLPDAPKPQPTVRLSLDRGKLRVALENRGNAHLVAQSVRLVGRAADGSTVLQEDLPAWYVLAGGVRNYELSPSNDTCKKLTQVSANANTDHGAARADYSVPAGACDQP